MGDLNIPVLHSNNNIGVKHERLLASSAFKYFV